MASEILAGEASSNDEDDSNGSDEDEVNDYLVDN